MALNEKKSFEVKFYRNIPSIKSYANMKLKTFQVNMLTDKHSKEKKNFQKVVDHVLRHLFVIVQENKRSIVLKIR